MAHEQIVLSDHSRIDMLISDDGLFRGLGSVIVDGVPLRHADVPMRFQLDTPDGILYTQMRFCQTVRLPDGGVSICLEAIGTPWGRGEIQDDYNQDVLTLGIDDTPVRDDVQIELRPVQRSLGGRTWHGFSYRLLFTSVARRVHRALIRSSWELGGGITGNTVLMPGQCNQPVWRGAKDTHFTSNCLRTLDRYGQMFGSSFQLGPRGSMAAPFDYQHGPAGALLGYWPEFSGISSVIESRPNEDVLQVVDEYRLPLATEMTTPSKWILFTPGDMPEHTARDLWWDVSQAVQEGVRGQFGIEQTLMVPESPYHQGLGYKNRVENGRLQLSLREGTWVDHPDVLDAYADDILPRLAELGFKRFKPEAVTESDVTVLGMDRKLDKGIHGDLHCSSICGTHVHLPSDFWGGMAGWRRMYERGKSLGMEIGHWMAPHMSPRSPIFREHPEYVTTSNCGLPAGGGYGFETLVVANWNSGFADWAFDNLRRWHDEAGLDYLWNDSYSNLGMLQVNYRDEMRTYFSAFSAFLARIQQVGIKGLSFESMSVLGCPSFGVTDLQGIRVKQNKAVAGQNDFGWWAEEPDMICNMHLNLGHIRPTRSDDESARLQFQAMANRGMIFYRSAFSHQLELAPWWQANVAVYNRAEPYMRGTRRLLPGRQGVVWHSDAGRCVWAFTDVAIAADGSATVQALNDRPASQANNTIQLRAGGVYLIATPSTDC